MDDRQPRKRGVERNLDHRVEVLFPVREPALARRVLVEVLELGLADNVNGPVAERMCAAAQAAGISSESVGVPYGTDAAAFGAAGVPSIVFCPGSIDQAHTADEWLALDQLALASEALYEVGRRWS